MPESQTSIAAPGINDRITSLIFADGVLATKDDNNYHHEGFFIDSTEIHFEITGLGGISAGANYSVVGIKQ